MAQIELKNVSKIYRQRGRDVVAVEGLNLTIEDGSFVALLGPSGCGKSSTLRMIAGLERADEGAVLFDGERVNDLSPSDRNVAMAFESYGLYPHLSVYENLAFCLRVQGLEKKEIDHKIHEVSQILRIEQVLNRKPAVLSGGQQQRVSLGRALIRNPRVSLLDEPLSHIGTEVRDQLRTDLKEFVEAKKTTTIFVTHDQQDALSLADYVAVMLDGHLQQFGTSSEVLLRPKNRFVAEFLGEPPINIIECGWRTDDGRILLEDGPLRMRPPSHWAEEAVKAADKKVLVGVRPSHLHVVRDGKASPDEDSAVLNGRIDTYEWLGNRSHVSVEVNGKLLTVLVGSEVPIEKGADVTLRFFWRDACALPDEPSKAATAGEQPPE